MPLTDATIRKAKPGLNPRGEVTPKSYKLGDTGGLYLEVSPSGGKWWRLKYRCGGKEKRLSLGTYPDTGLADARGKRDAARKLLAAGVDPAEQRKAEKAAGVERSGNSFEVLAREWIASRTGAWVPGHVSRILLRLVNDVFPWIGARPIADVTPPELLSVLRRIESRGAIETAHRTLQNCGQVFRYSIVTGRATSDPSRDLRGALRPVNEKHFSSITDPAETGALLRAIDAYNGSFVTKCALKLAPLVFVRPSELRLAEWSEIDLDNAQWNIPAKRMKMRQAHLVPLSRQAIAILRELHALTGRGGYVFPGARTPKRPMSNNAVNAALRRMNYDKDTMTGHGFRAMARTIMDEVLHIRPDYIEHQLAHAVRDPNGRAYNRTAHLPERCAMMQQWADYLDTLKQGGNVVPIRRLAG